MANGLFGARGPRVRRRVVLGSLQGQGRVYTLTTAVLESHVRVIPQKFKTVQQKTAQVRYV